jgi:hypothetical protein
LTTAEVTQAERTATVSVRRKPATNSQVRQNAETRGPGLRTEAYDQLADHRENQKVIGAAENEAIVNSVEMIPRMMLRRKAVSI